ncbi:hypothetical protein [Dokdonia sp. Asnod3-C12]|uniref:hypothetical protein n=1 Tax=Dokdonia sp. Asnod3-C12 TaxID=3160575 RepID=UPI00386FFBD5
MIRRLTFIAMVSILLMGCASAVINTVMKINTGEAKRFAKAVMRDEPIDFRKFSVSSDLKGYLKSDEGVAYYKTIRNETGALKKLKLKSVKGTTSDTMNYRFIASFKENEAKREVRVQTYGDHRFINVFVTPWQDTMEPLEK